MKITKLIDIAMNEKNAIVDGPFGSSLKTSDYVDEGIPVLQGKNITGDKFKFSEIRFISEKKAKELSRSQVRVGDILIVKIGSIGYVAQVDDLGGYSYAIIPANLAKISLDSEKIFAGYFLQVFKQPDIKHSLLKLASKTAQPALSLEKIKGFKIPIPEDYDEQIRIATILSKAERLIVKQKESINTLDEFLKSTFLEMFGDPVRNENRWERVTIGDLIKEVKYGTSKSAEGGKYKYLRMNNITSEGYWDFSNLKYINIEDTDKEKYVLKRNDIVFNRTNSKELVGKTAVYCSDEEVIIAGYLIRVRTKSDVNPWYIWGYLNSKAGKQRLFNLCRNIVGMANINAQELQSIPIIKPPTDLQNKFAIIVEKVEAIKAKYLVRLTELENLYGSLSQRAFKGELDLSKVAVDVKIKVEPGVAILEGSAPTVEVTNDFSQNGLKSIIKTQLNQPFSFGDLWDVLQEKQFEESPTYEEVKKIIFDMLDGDEPFLSQEFNDSKEKREIVLRVNV